ncbi:MAG: hypothetical protein WDW36_006561 [Sanguina aurantia]
MVTLCGIASKRSGARKERVLWLGPLCVERVRLWHGIQHFRTRLQAHCRRKVKLRCRTQSLTLGRAVASLNECEPYHRWLFGLFRDLVECGRRMYMGKSAHLRNQHGPPDAIKVTRALRDLHPLPAADESEVEESVTDADEAEDVPDPYHYQRNSECFHCHEVGHWAAICPHKPGNIACHFCDGMGHGVTHCGARVRR